MRDSRHRSYRSRHIRRKQINRLPGSSTSLTLFRKKGGCVRFPTDRLESDMEPEGVHLSNYICINSFRTASGMLFSRAAVNPSWLFVCSTASEITPERA